MDDYILNTVDYNYTTLNHEGFGGVCKYIATPKRVGYSRLLVKHEKIQSACNAFMCSRLAELCDVYTTTPLRILFLLAEMVTGSAGAVFAVMVSVSPLVVKTISDRVLLKV